MHKKGQIGTIRDIKYQKIWEIMKTFMSLFVPLCPFSQKFWKGTENTLGFFAVLCIWNIDSIVVKKKHKFGKKRELNLHFVTKSFIGWRNIVKCQRHSLCWMTAAWVDSGSLKRHNLEIFSILVEAIAGRKFEYAIDLSDNNETLI